jgi:transposase-like protein
MALLVIGIILALHHWRTRLLRIRKRFLQVEVDRQTIRLNNQKAEIEKKNKELSQANSLVTAHNLQLEHQKNELAHQASELQVANEKLSYATEELKKASIQLDLDNWNLKKKVKEEKKARIVSNEVSFAEFLQIFPSEYTCTEYLANLKWQRGYYCRKCGNTSHKNGFSEFDRRCSKCEYNESATANTILHGIRMPFPKAFYLIYITINHDGKYTLDQLSEVLKLKKSTVGKFRRKILRRKEEYKKALGYEVGDWENLFLSIPVTDSRMKISI